MSATLVGAVLKIGPEDRTKRFVMVAIADNADDYGFACPSVETIAGMTVCDERTVRRVLLALEEEAWIRIGRKMLNRGKSNAYFLNVEKLEAAPGAKSRKSPLHADLERMLVGQKKVSADPKPVEKIAPVEDMEPDDPEGEVGAAAPVDDLEPDAAREEKSPGMVPGENVQEKEKSADISQGGHRTFSTFSPDISCIPISKNRCQPLYNPNQGKTPQPPLRGGAVDLKSRKGNGGGPARNSRDADGLRKANAAAGGPCDAEDPRVRVEAERAMEECGWSNPRLLRLVEAAIAMQMRRERMSPVEARMMMVESWQRWKADAQQMRHSIGPRKFIGEGYWLDETRWPYDYAKMERERQRAGASVGYMH